MESAPTGVVAGINPSQILTLSTTGQHTRQSSQSKSATSSTIRTFNAASTMEPRKSDESYTTSTANATPKSLPLYRDRPSLQVMAAFFALNLSIFLVALDTVLIPTALPTISQSFHIPDSLYAWTGSAYLLANAASIPFWGALSDVFGRKPVILFANGIFLFGSIICAVSVSASILIAGRAVQGLGGGGVVVLVYVCVSDLFSIRDRSFYIGIVGAMWAFASALGPVLGGIFADSVGWRWCFYINLPIISFSIVVLCFSLHLHNPRTPLLTGLASMDWLGTLTILTATILLLVGLQIGGTTSYTRPAVIIFLIFGSLTYMAFPFSQLWVEKRDGSPITPLRIFNDVSNLSALGVCACDALVFNSVAYFLPLYFQIVLGRSPTTTGVYMLAIAIPLATICFASGHFINKTGRFMDVLQVGLFLMTLGVGLLIALDTRLDLGKIIGTLIVIGLGFGPNFGAPLIALQTRVQKSDIATGTAAFGFVRMVSGTVGLVIGQVVFQALMKPHFQVFVDCGIEEGFARELTSGDAISQIATVARLPEAQRMVIREEFVGALRGTWILYTVIGAVGLLVSFGIKRTKLHQESMCLADIEMIRDDGSARSSS